MKQSPPKNSLMKFDQTEDALDLKGKKFNRGI